MIMLFLGPPGSGKDTQANLITDKFGYSVISTGALVREEIKSGSELGIKAKEYYDKGLWVPDEIVYSVLQNKLDNMSNKDIILTGAVRTAHQVELLDDCLNSIGMKLNKVVYFELSEDEGIKRITSRIEDPKTGRPYNSVTNPPPKELVLEKRNIDQDIEALKQRFIEARKNDEGIKQKYEERDILLTIDASKSIDEIHSDVINKLELK